MEIPDHIWAAADAVLDAMCKESCGDLDPCAVAARAILAERERCAKIAEGEATHWHFEDGYRACIEVAGLIRTPSTGEET